MERARDQDSALLPEDAGHRDRWPMRFRCWGRTGFSASLGLEQLRRPVQCRDCVRLMELAKLDPSRTTADRD